MVILCIDQGQEDTVLEHQHSCSPISPVSSYHFGLQLCMSQILERTLDRERMRRNLLGLYLQYTWPQKTKARTKQEGKTVLAEL